VSALVLAACVGVATGCGGGKKNTGPARATGTARNVDPTPAESAGDAVDRIRGAVTASGCDAVKGVLHSTYGNISDVACRAVKVDIDGFRKPKAKAYKTGAVVDYETLAGEHRTAVLALDADRTYRLDFVLDEPGPTVGTSKPGAFDRSADTAVAALKTGDCDAFLRVVSRSMGLGTGSDETVCRRVSEVPFRRELVSSRAARPVALGGNAAVAFYKLRTSPEGYYTMVMVRERPHGGGSPRYVLVNALPAQ
jgi:hypothetical protein